MCGVAGTIFPGKEEYTMTKACKIVVALCLALAAVAAPVRADENLRQQVKEIKAAMPKFGIPMREVGERFQNMYFAAKEGNWGLARYMSRSMNAAMDSVRVSQAYLSPFWDSFYQGYFNPVNKAILAEDFKAFDREFASVIAKCNDCHYQMGFQFVKVTQPSAPATRLIDFGVKSKAADFRE
jgi:hypothetical protein